jgi:NAD(P)-dependent dehydrogenase (short-subunit alcohol dehydrogenase family)
VGALEEVDDTVQAAGGKATLVPMDLAEHDLIDQLGASIFERFGKLDVLVANAAHLGTLSPVAHGNPAMWQQVINVNLIANQRLIRSVDPLLRASSTGRAIFVSAPQARMPKSFWSAYAVSKAGLEMMVRMYGAEVAKSTIKVNLIDPGTVSTALRAHAFPGEAPDAHPISTSLLDRFVELGSRDCPYHGARIAFEDRPEIQAMQDAEAEGQTIDGNVGLETSVVTETGGS